MSSLTKRALSAVAILLVLGILVYFFGMRGLWFFGFALCSAGIHEYSKLIFANESVPDYFSLWLFALSCLQLFILSYFGISVLFTLFLFTPIYIMSCLWFFNAKAKNEDLLNWIFQGCFGLFYAGALPAFALTLLIQPGSAYKFFWLLLAAVFTGDTFAYLAGSTFKGSKLMPQVSPNKTISGALGGLFGAMFSGALMQIFFIKDASIVFIICLCVVVALFAQSGDLFESLLKRVANVKDSGHFMPGHGGVLDRLDGVILAAPAVYVAWLIFENFSFARL